MTPDEKEQDLFNKLCKAADDYIRGEIDGDEFHSVTVDYTDHVKLSQIEPPHDENHYRYHTPAGPNPECANCRFLNWSQP